MRTAAVAVAMVAGGLAAAPGALAADMTCTETAANPPPILRAEGRAEKVSDVTLTCTGGTPTAVGNPVPTFNFTLFLNTNVTSRLLSDTDSEGALLVDGGSPRFGKPNANQLVWSAVPIDPPGAGTRKVRITNVRAAAPALGPGNPVVSFLSASAGIAVVNPQQTVGTLANSLATSVRNPENTDVLAASTPAPACPQSTTRVATLRFSEAQAVAFKRRSVVSSASNPAAAAAQDEDALASESMLFLPTRNAIAGLADFGTRVRAEITGVQPGVRVFVDATPAGTGHVARLTRTDTAGFSAPAVDAEGRSELTVTGGSATATWEVVESDATQRGDIDVGVYVRTTPGETAPGPATASVAMGYGAQTPASANSALVGPVPRFVDSLSAPVGFETVVDCPPAPVPPPGGGTGPGGAVPALPAVPDTAIARLPRVIDSEKLKSFKGTATSANGSVDHVDVAVLRTVGGARAAATRKRCLALRANGKLRRTRVKSGRCESRVFLKASGTSRWKFRLKRPLPPGSYVVYSRAVDAAGTSENAFTAGDGNRRAFRVR